MPFGPSTPSLPPPPASTARALSSSPSAAGFPPQLAELIRQGGQRERDERMAGEDDEGERDGEGWVMRVRQGEMEGEMMLEGRWWSCPERRRRG
ncbi:hypothetical protein MRB53_002693 [Persea americana]|uniref:Uncharacterized protein n=1 Tax=Persea americana TaxID=3435 RepID=A0ACC2MW63_PERAE|nr:hypothetical protein MRB53_002693 [Persea americana]